VEIAAEQKAEKYHNLSSDHTFQSITMENLDAFIFGVTERFDVGWVVSLEKSENLLSFPAPVCCRTVI